MATANKAKAKTTSRNTPPKRKPRTASRVAKNTKNANTKAANRFFDAADQAGENFDAMAENVEQRAESAVSRAVGLTKGVIGHRLAEIKQEVSEAA